MTLQDQISPYDTPITVHTLGFPDPLLQALWRAHGGDKMRVVDDLTEWLETASRQTSKQA